MKIYFKIVIIFFFYHKILIKKHNVESCISIIVNLDNMER
jgi:hypothetical protein